MAPLGKLTLPIIAGALSFILPETLASLAWLIPELSMTDVLPALPGRGLLLGQFLVEILFLKIEVRPVARRIDEWVWAPVLQPCVLLGHPVEAAVRGEEHIARQCPQYLESAYVIVGNLRIL